MTTADLIALLSSLTDEELAHRVAFGGLTLDALRNWPTFAHKTGPA